MAPRFHPRYLNERQLRLCVEEHVWVDGRRVLVELDADRWYEVRVRMVGSEITCSLDGEHKLVAQDDTIARAGSIELWTKADTVTSFDDLRVRAVPPVPEAFVAPSAKITRKTPR